MTYPIDIEQKQETAVVTLNRPEVMNAVNHNMRNALIDAMRELNKASEIKAIVLAGAGDRAFCAGQDLDEAAAFSADEVNSWMQHQCAMLAAIRGSDKPVIAAFDGVAAGVGFQIGLVADYRIAAPEIRVGQPEVHVGLASVMGSYLMSQHLGHGRNQELSLLGTLIEGLQAYELGLINRLVAKPDVLTTALEIAATYATLPVNAIQLTKQRFRSLSQANFEEACQAVARYQTESYRSGEPQARMRAFIAKRDAHKTPATA